MSLSIGTNGLITRRNQLLDTTYPKLCKTLLYPKNSQNMSRNYNLCTWMAVSTLFSTLLQASEPSPKPEHRLYSDVAALRPPFPMGDGENPTATAGSTGIWTVGEPSSVGVGHSWKYIFPTTNTASCISIKTSEEHDSSPWHTVGRWWAHSLDSAEPVQGKTEQRGQALREKIPATTAKTSNMVPTAAEAAWPKAIQHQWEPSTVLTGGTIEP